MSLKVYLPLAAASFLVATLGSDLSARMGVAGEPFSYAMRQHIYYAGVQPVLTLLLLAPFAAVAVICAGLKKRSTVRNAAVIFGAAMLALFIFYLEGYRQAQTALIEHHWTASALFVGLLPFFRGLPVVLAVLLGAVLTANPKTKSQR